MSDVETTEASAPVQGPQWTKRQRKIVRESQRPGGPNRIGSKQWMRQVYDEKPPFPEELFETIFTKDKIQTLVAALKIATVKEVEESKRLLESDYTYSLMIASHKISHVAVHLSRM